MFASLVAICRLALDLVRSHEKGATYRNFGNVWEWEVRLRRKSDP